MARRAAAVLFLCILAVILAAETAALCRLARETMAGGPKLPPDLPSCCAARLPRRAPVSPVLTRIVCTCKCCGPVCPMGERCTCNAPKVRVRIVAGVEINAPGCSPRTGGDAPSFLLTLPPAVPAAGTSLAPRPVQHTRAGVPTGTLRISRGHGRPPTPPPEVCA